MSNMSTVRVQLVGFTPSTRTLLKSTFAGYARKGRAFVEAASGEKPSVYLLDSDDIQACEAWRDAHQDVIDAPVVAIGRAPFDLDIPIMGKPLQWNKLYDTLVAALSVPAPVWSDAQRALLREKKRAQLSKPAINQSANLRKKLLVCDDSATVRHYMAIKLAPFGYTVETAESGEEAIEKCKSTVYAAVFMDVEMGGMDGYDTCKTIRPLLPPDTPIVMVTTRDSPFDKMRGTLAGCSAYLVKPVDENTIAETMAKWLKATARR